MKIAFILDEEKAQKILNMVEGRFNEAIELVKMVERLNDPAKLAKYKKEADAELDFLEELLIQYDKNKFERELKAFGVIYSLLDFSTALRFPSNQPILRITNKLTNEYWEIPLTQKQYKSIKGVLL